MKRKSKFLIIITLLIFTIMVSSVQATEQESEEITQTEEIEETETLDVTEESENIELLDASEEIIEDIEEGLYTFYAAVGNNQVMEVAGAGTSNETNIQTHQSNGTNAQIFRLIKNSDGSYEIINKNSSKAVDVKSGNASNGTNVQQYERNGTNAQKWILEYAGDGYYYIVSKLNTNYCLDIAAGNNTNGTNIQLYEKNGTNAQKFKLQEIEPMQSKQTVEDGTYKLVYYADDTKVLDVASGSTQANANIQIYVDNSTDAQKFEIEYGTDGYYTIINKKSGKPVSIEEGEYASEGNVFQGDTVSSDAQKWIIQENTDGTYTIFSKQSELCLDVAGGSTANSTNVQQYRSNETNAQKWILIPIEDIESEQTIEDGEYTIKTALNTGKAIDVQSGSTSSGTYIQIYDENNTYAQRFTFEYGTDGYYTIINKNSGKVLDVANGSVNAGTYVWQYEKNNSNAQKWIIQDAGDGYYYIISKLSGLYLTVENSSTSNETKLMVSNFNNKSNQKFKIVEYEYITPVVDAIEDGVYQISMKSNSNKVLDISTGTYSNGGNVQIWDNDKVQQQKFLIEQIDNTGYYTITSVNSGKVLDVASGSQKASTNVQQYESNNSDAQKWIIQPCGDGYYNIISKCNNLALDVAGGSTTNGTNVQVYFNNGTDAQKFKFESIEIIAENTYEIETALNSIKVLDVDSASTNDGANIQLWEADNVDQQKFTLEYDNGEYIIRAKHSDKVLTVDTSNNNVYQSTYQNLDNQKWTIEPAGNGYYYIVSKYNGLYIDVDNASTSNGTNIKVYSKNTSANAQKFRFVTGFRTFFEEGTYGSSGLKVSGDSRGTSLTYYKFGKGSNVLFAVFSIHGFEDGYNNDGSELTYIAEQFKTYMENITDRDLINNWTIYIFPSANPDGQTYGWTNNGPGRTTLYSSASGNQGIDMNRNWQTGSSYTRYTDARNYNGTAAYQAYEVSALRTFLLNKKSSSGQTILVDLHGWLNETIGDSGLGSYYRSQFGMSTHISSYGTGYLVNWARQQLGSGGRTARSVLVELPEVSSHQNVIDRNYATKYINATLTMLRENG